MNSYWKLGNSSSFIVQQYHSSMLTSGFFQTKAKVFWPKYLYCLPYLNHITITCWSRRTIISDLYVQIVIFFGSFRATRKILTSPLVMLYNIIVSILPCRVVHISDIRERSISFHLLYFINQRKNKLYTYIIHGKHQTYKQTNINKYIQPQRIIYQYFFMDLFFYIFSKLPMPEHSLLNYNKMSLNKTIALEQKDYSLFAILSKKKCLTSTNEAAISIPQETLKPYKSKQFHASYISPKQITRLNLKLKFNPNLKESYKPKIFYSDSFSIKHEYKMKANPYFQKQKMKKEIVSSDKQKKRNIKQYLHEVAKKNKRVSQRIQSDNHLSDKVKQSNKFKTVLIVKNINLDRQQRRRESFTKKDLFALYKKHPFPIHQTYCYFFNRQKCYTEQQLNELGRSQRIDNMNRTKVTIEQLCNLRQQLKKCSQSQQTFQKYKRRQPDASLRQLSHDCSLKQRIDDTINSIYNSFYQTNYENRKKELMHSTLFRNQKCKKNVKEEEISPWMKKNAEDQEFS